MIELNKTPIRTSKNYGINSVFVDENAFEHENAKNFDFNKKFDDGIKILSNFQQKTTQIIGENLAKEIEDNANFSKRIEITKNIENPIIFDFDLSENIFIGTNEICLDENVEAKIIVKFHSMKKTYSNSVLKIVCKKGGRLDIAVLFDFENGSSNFVSFDNLIGENAILNYNIIDFGSKYSIQNFLTKLCGDNSVCNLNSIYLGEKDNIIDLLYHQDIFGRGCTANIDVVGALLGKARKSFKGIINFEKGCKKSFGSENEFCLLLSDNAKSKALPMLMCGEEEVDGKHSTSVGRADEKQLFYLMSRGLSMQDSLKLIVKAKLGTITQKLFDENLKNEINERVDSELDEKF